MTDQAFPDALPPQYRLHWYVLERVLGQGGFGITYLARDANLDQPVAIKEYLPVEVATRRPDATIRSRTDDQRDRYRWGLERFIQEARTLARFDHPNIVRVHSVFEFNDTAYMVMRFEHGQNLAALLDRRGTLPEDELLRILLPILDGLELVHGAGFIHRDIKPDNIHIRADGTPVLLDFGSARHAVGKAHTVTILVAPGYAPFEQYYSDAESQGPWTDIYSLGATCYRAIAGRAPLDAIARSKGILGSTRDVLVPASVIGAGRYSGRFLAAIDHALQFSEKDRPQTIGEWRLELAGDGARVVAAQATERAPAHRAPPPASLTPSESPAPPMGSTPVYPASTPREAERFPLSAARGGLFWSIAGAVIAAATVAGYLGLTSRSDERALMKVAELEQKLKDKEAAEAERTAKALAAEEARKREEAARLRAEAEKREADRKREAEEAARRDEARKKQAELQRPAPKPAPAPAPAPTPAPEIAKPAPAPEPPKPAPPPSADELLARADRALGRGDFPEAIGTLRPLADAGNAKAQYRLGDLYAEGRGVGRDDAAAAAWFEKAALRGDAAAQFKLGGLYASGRGVSQNNNLAYVWFAVAARLGHPDASVQRARFAALLQPAELTQADRLVDSTVGRLPKSP